MLSKVLSPGDRLEIEKIVSEEKKKQLIEENSVFAKTLISQIYDMIDETQLKIAMPIVEGRVIPLPTNARFDVCFFTSGGLYKSKFVVLDRFKENGLYVLVVELVSELKKYQRRQYYRLECTMDIEYLVVENELVDSLKDDEEYVKEILDGSQLNKGIVIDISGGGIRFASRDKLDCNSTVLVKINIAISDGKSVYGVLGKVLNSSRMINNELMYEQRIEYSDIQNGDREIIIRYIFEQERRMRQKN
jgi:c-di-GMP-binding flagellar brake protein YcgR